MRSMLILLLLLNSCKDRQFSWKWEIRSYDYIPYVNPMEFAGTGTLVSGKYSNTSIIAPPQECFPDEIEGIPTELRVIDHTDVARKKYKSKFSGSGKIGLANFVEAGNSIIKLGGEYYNLETVEFEMKGVHIEYLNTAKLIEFYRNNLSNTCYNLLRHSGFITQALRVEEMKFSFYNKKGGKIKLDLEKIEAILDLNLDVEWEIEEEYTLVIKTPKYIGMQVGRFIEQEDHVNLYVATDTVKSKYKFVFRTDFNLPEMEYPEEDIVDPDLWIDNFSVYYK